MRRDHVFAALITLTGLVGALVPGAASARPLDLSELFTFEQYLH